MKMLSRLFFCGLLVALLGFLPAVAQVDYSTATLKGVVYDPQGAVISKATVTVTNANTGLQQQRKQTLTAAMPYARCSRVRIRLP